MVSGLLFVNYSKYTYVLYLIIIILKCQAARTKKNSIDSTSTESATAIKGPNESKMKKTKKDKEEDKKKRPSVDKTNVIFCFKYFFKKCMIIIVIFVQNELEDQNKKDSDSITGNEFIQAYDAEHKTNDSMFNDFNIDDFLKPDYLSEMHIGGENDGNAVGSRFRQWFTHDSSRASSASTEMLNSETNSMVINLILKTNIKKKYVL